MKVFIKTLKNEKHLKQAKVCGRVYAPYSTSKYIKQLLNSLYIYIYIV